MTKNLHYLLVMALLTLSISNCNAISGMSHYSSPGESNIGIEFDYPKEWELEFLSETTSISLYDPQHPPATPSRQHSPVSYIQEVHLGVDNDSNPGIQDDMINWYLEATDAIGGEVVDNRDVNIDHITGRWISRIIPKRQGLNEDFEIYNIAIFFFADNRLYYIDLVVPLEEKEGEFVRGFEQLVESIEFVQ